MGLPPTRRINTAARKSAFRPLLPTQDFDFDGRYRGNKTGGFSEREIVESRKPDYSALMLAARITLPHFSVSAAMNFPKSADEPERGVPPKSASRAFIFGSASAALIPSFSLAMISTGVSLGAPMPVQTL